MVIFLPTACDIINVKNKLNKIFDRFDYNFFFSTLQKLEYVDKFAHMIKVACTKI